MPRRRPPHLHREVTRHGKPVWYVRVKRGSRVRIRADFGTLEFDAEYHSAVAGALTAAPKRAGGGTGTLSWLIDRYRETPAWISLSLATRRQRENILRQVVDKAGGEPFAKVTAAAIAAGRDRRGATPFQAKHFLDTMRGLFAWALDAQFVKVNPAAGVKYPTLRSGPGFPIWTRDDVSAFMARWPLGTRQYVWLALLLYTGLRRGDVVRLGKQHVRDGVAYLETEKTKTPVALPMLAPLREALDAGPIGDLTFIVGADGEPFSSKEIFANEFKKACRAAGVNKSAHGLRKLAATVAATNGATASELNAIFGWSGTRMAGHYTQSADRARLSQGAMAKLIDVPQAFSPHRPHPTKGAGASAKKSGGSDA
jgi:integrase